MTFMSPDFVDEELSDNGFLFSRYPSLIDTDGVSRDPEYGL